jgi:hypothetical protein
LGLQLRHCVSQNLSNTNVRPTLLPLSCHPRRNQLSIKALIWQSDSAKREIKNPGAAADDEIFHTVLGKFGFTKDGVCRANQDLLETAK